MSRPSSRKGKKEKKKTPKQQIADLTAENAELTTKLETLRADHDQMTIKVLALTKKILEGVNKRDYGIQESTQLLTINPDTLMEMVGHLIVQKKIYDMSVEARVEELELRVTQMSSQLAKMMKKTLAYEQGLADVASSRDLDEVRDKIYNLQLIAGEEFHHFQSHEALHEKDPPVVLGEIERPSSATRRTLENAVKLNLVPPLRRLQGETHIRNMNRDLRLYIMKELSLEKPSGADWRMLGERCGIPTETLSHWQSLNLECPMGRVFSKWGESPMATVRQLHRHLMCPRMRCTILGKMVADFYEVD